MDLVSRGEPSRVVTSKREAISCPCEIGTQCAVTGLWCAIENHGLDPHVVVEVLEMSNRPCGNNDEALFNSNRDVVVGKRDGTAHGGHLLEARVRPTLQVTLIEAPAHLRRVYDPRSKLALIELNDSPKA